MIKPWIEAMRLRTLPVSIAGVITAVGFALHDRVFQWLPALLCLLFAVLAQIASNFANEYYDYRDGLDRAGREGPRRGVTEGDITPGAMKRAHLRRACPCMCNRAFTYILGRLVAAPRRDSDSTRCHRLLRRSISAVAPRAWRGSRNVLLRHNSCKSHILYTGRCVHYAGAAGLGGNRSDGSQCAVG